MAISSPLLNKLSSKHVIGILEDWYHDLLEEGRQKKENWHYPEVVKGQLEEIPRNQLYVYWYFTLLGKGLEKICSILDPQEEANNQQKAAFLIPSTLEQNPSSICQEHAEKETEEPLKKIKNEICFQTNPYDFAYTLETKIREVILLDPQIEKPDNKVFNADVFVLYHFHRQHLEELAERKFWPNTQIGQISFLLTT